MLSAQLELQDAYCHTESRHYDKHKDEVNCLAFSPDFEMMVTGSDDRRVRIFNRVKGQLVTQLFGPQGAIKGVAVSADSKMVASGSMDGSVHIWRTCNAELIYHLEGHSSGVETVAFSPDATLLCSGGWDSTAILWNLLTGTPMNIFTGHHKAIQCCAFSHNGNLLATGSWDHQVRLWNIGGQNAGDCHVLKEHAAAVHTVVFSCSGMLASGSHDKTICLWNPRISVLLRVLRSHTGWVRALDFSRDGGMLASVGDDETCRLWDLLTGDCTKTMELEHSIGQIHTVAFKGDDSLIVAGTNIMVGNEHEKVRTTSLQDA